jgi:hypothetical protein
MTAASAESNAAPDKTETELSNTEDEHIIICNLILGLSWTNANDEPYFVY